MSSTKFYSMSVLPLVVMMSMASAHAVHGSPSVHDHGSYGVVTDVQFVGLQRITAESLYPILPTTVGDSINQEQLSESIKSLYDTGNFSDVQVVNDDGVLRFLVVERPIIAEINYKGNTLIPKQGLEDGLKHAGLVKGSVLKQATLFGVANELQQQYILQGYYNSDINVEQTLLDGNRVKLDITFIEGKPAKVIDINIIGNDYFSDEDIKDVFALKEASWTRLLSKSDRYAQEKLAASLENLKAMYQNSGFIRFNIDNATLNVSEDKKHVFIEVAISEGQQYAFGKVSFLGNTPYSQEELNKQVSFATNEQYSKAKLDDTTANIKNKLGDDGYYFAQIRPIPRINDDTHTVDMDYYIDPVRPVYVRRINFFGNTKTQDEVLRREMRQLEGALASSQKIQLSRIRLMRTGYFKSVVADVKPVPNQLDQVDVNITVVEQPTGSSTIAAGYSQSGGVTFQFDLSQRNFLGTGNGLNFGLSRSETRENYNIGITDPYFTKDGVSQGINAYYRKTKLDDKNVSNYITDSYGATLNYGYPVDEDTRVSAGFNIDRTDITGGRWMGISNVQSIIDDGGRATVHTGNDKGRYNFENDYTSYNLMLGWSHSTLDKPVFPTKGMSHNVDFTIGLGDKTYQKASYTGNLYLPVGKGFIGRGYTKLGYGHNLPFYDNFYAGGYGTVRGYDYYSLGPKSTTFFDTQFEPEKQNYLPEEVGGNAMAAVGAELILPMPFKGDWADQVRPVLFVEGAQVFDTTGKENKTFIYHGNDTKIPLLTQDKQMRYSAGAGITWFTPIGPIAISYAKPFNKKEGDKVDEVQFQIGNVF